MPLTGLTQEQFAAATAPPSPIIIVAGPGSGKTRTIVARARYYSQVIDPRRILLVTFTNKAAREAEERLSRLGASGFYVATFHSLCARNLLARTHFSIADEDAAKSIIKEAVEIGSLGLDPGRLRDWISCERNKGYTLLKPPPMATTEFVEVWKKYEELKKHYRLYDFDDLLSEFNNTGVVDEVAQFFQMVLVDEVQDSCAEQLSIMCRLAVPHRNVTAVGDVDQCVAPETMVSTPSGAMAIGEIQSGTSILSVARNGTRQSWFSEKKTLSGKRIKIVLESGQELVCSPTHQMFARMPLSNRRGNYCEESSTYLTLTINSESMGSGVLHSLNLTTSDHDLAQTIENSSLGQWFRPKTKYGGKWAGWQLDATSTSFAKILGVARYARELLGGRVQYRQKANFPVGTFEVMPASNLFPGVEVPVVTDDEVHVGVVKEVRDEGIGALVDISVPEYGNFIANGIVTHNSIYGWRGAQPSNLKKFRDEFGAQVFELTKNHRSTGSIVDFSRKIIDQFPAPMRTSALSSTRHRGFDPSVYVFYDNEAEAKAISTWVSSLLDQGVPPQEIAVLFRTNAQTQPVEEAFTEASIRYTVVGAMSFYDRKEVRDALSFLRVQVNDRDIPSLRRSLLCVPGVGDGSVRDIVSIMNESGCGPLVAISEYCQSNKSPRADMLQQYADCMHQMQELKPEEGIKLIADEFLAPKYAEDKRSQDRLENVNALCNVAARFSSVGQLVVSASLVSSSDEQHRGVCLATCHAVKGLEFSSVWVAGVEDDLFPHSKADSEEEENRLLYVACTRAKDLLAVSWCRMRRSWGKIKQSQPSRFLEAIGASDE